MIREQTDTIPPQGTPSTGEFEPVSLTPGAAAKLQEVMAAKGLTEAGLRVFVSGGGCSGLEYGIAFETEAADDDHVFESPGVRVYVDPISIEYLQGSTVDYEDNLMGGGFKILNPNAASTCGCGQSFRTAAEGASDPAGAGNGGCGCG